MSNSLIVAAAGSGKTTEIVQKSLEIQDEYVLVTTYTEANAGEIKNKYFEKNGCIPSNIHVQTWFSLLIQHGVKPYQNALFEFKVKGMVLMNRKSGFRFWHRDGYPVYFGEKDFENYYFNNHKKIYSDKLSKLVCKLNEETDGKVFERLTSIFPNIFIDECQDLAGYDLEIIKLLSDYTSNLMLVCDPRQVTYLTHHERKYKKYRDGRIEEFIKTECKTENFNIDIEMFSQSFRCNQPICEYSHKLYPDFPDYNSHQDESTGHDGIFLVDEENVDEYLETFHPVQLRWDITNKKINSDFPVYNFGESKGLTFDRVLIYPTDGMLDWMKDHNSELSNATRAKFYVAITRARYSVGIVCDTQSDFIMEGVNIFE